ncbi:PDZ domain-containing protein [Desulfonispora thiosulfatigenes]|nr:PDZ domain-containing protein [Desulfonispora thiosulfatigenes]
MIIIWFQFKRLAKMKSSMFNLPEESIIVPTIVASLYGLLGGFIGSIILVIVGLSILEIGIQYLWILAVGLMLINQRFMCFAYAGGILSLCKYFFGFPEISIPQIMGLVAILHLVEAILILMSGHLGAVPVYVKDKTGKLVGGFSLQKFWPLPIVAMIAMAIPESNAVTDVIKMPEWWPLIKSELVIESENMVYLMMPVIAGLGYGDIALTGHAKQKSLRSAFHLAVYSVILLILAIIATNFYSLSILAALFAPLGHEFIIYLGRRHEFKSEPKYVDTERGIMILDLLNNSPLKRAGLGTGDVILSLNENEVNGYSELEYFLQFTESNFQITYFSDKKKKIHKTLVKRKGFEASLGLIPVPRGYNDSYLDLSNSDGFFQKSFTKVLKRIIK